MSDVGINFPWWFGVAVLLLYSLPFTTLALVGLGIAWFSLRRRAADRGLAMVKWSALAIAPFWLGGAFFAAGIWIGDVTRDIAEARRHTTLTQTTEIAGTRFPAGTRLTRDEGGKLQYAELPAGTTATRAGASWRDRIEFVMPGNAPGGAEGTIAAGTLAAPAVIEGIPCQAGQEVHFFWDGTLMYCTLAADATIGATIRAADGGVAAQNFRCMAAHSIHLQGIHPSGQLESCVLAEPTQIGQAICADDAELQIWNGFLQACTLAKPARFGPLDLPAGSKITNYNGAPSSFALPQAGDAVDGFGLRLPPGTEAFFCSEAMTLRQLNVDRSRYVAVAGVKLTGDIEFDCGTFRNGQLFEDAMVGGNQRRAGDLVTRADLFP